MRILARVMFLSLAGCAVNNHVFLGGQAHYYQNSDQTGRAVRVHLWGFHLITDTNDAGLTLGQSDRTLFYPGPASPALARCSATQPVDRHACTLVEAPVDQVGGWSLRQPVAALRRRTGVAIDLGRHHLGLILGFDQQAVIDLPAGVSASLFMQLSSQHPEQTTLCVHQYKETPP